MEEGFEATLSRKYNPNTAPCRIFDGAAEANYRAEMRAGSGGPRQMDAESA
jgi:hypothetical protein